MSNKCNDMLSIGYWIHKSAILCAHIILHEFVVLPEAQPSAKKHKRVQYIRAHVARVCICCTLETPF